MKGRYQVVRDICNGTPTERQLREHDCSLWGAMVRKFGTINKARAFFNDTPMTRTERRLIPDTKIISALRGYYAKHKKMPRANEWHDNKHEVSSATIYRKFGSWNQAMKAAGLK